MVLPPPASAPSWAPAPLPPAPPPPPPGAPPRPRLTRPLPGCAGGSRLDPFLKGGTGGGGRVVRRGGRAIPVRHKPREMTGGEPFHERNPQEDLGGSLLARHVAGATFPLGFPPVPLNPRPRP